MLMRLLFHKQTSLLPICAEASQIGLDATIEIASANFYCAIPTLRFGMDDFYENSFDYAKLVYSFVCANGM